MQRKPYTFLALAALLAAFGGHGPAASADSSDGQGAAVAPAGMRDGSHDFDFLIGKWKMTNHVLVGRLVGSHEWADFTAYDDNFPMPGGLGNEDVLKTDHWKDFEGLTLRTYDPGTGLWRLYWVDNRFSAGVIQPPVMGKFEGKVGVFEGPDTLRGKPVTVRYTWTVNPKGSKSVAHWEQAFSPDGGKTWEVNWQTDVLPMSDAEAAKYFPGS